MQEAEFITRLAYICGGIVTIGGLIALAAMVWSDMAAREKRRREREGKEPR